MFDSDRQQIESPDIISNAALALRERWPGPWTIGPYQGGPESCVYCAGPGARLIVRHDDGRWLAEFWIRHDRTTRFIPAADPVSALQAQIDDVEAGIDDFTLTLKEIRR